MTDEILKRIDAIATKLGATADHIWGVLVRQARIEGIEWIIWGVLWLALASYLINRTIWAWKNEKLDKDEHVISIVFGITATLLTVAGFMCLSNILGLFMNPEYWALRQITSMLGGK